MALPVKAATRICLVPSTNVWTEFTPLAMKHGAVNLGQGFPTFSPDDFVKQIASQVVTSPEALTHQYCRSQGHPELVAVLQERYSSLLGREVAMTEVEVTNGTTQALNLVFQALINPGDEVIVFEPYFDIYGYDIEMASGIPKYVSMRPKGTTANEWDIDLDELKAAITPKTKAILFNTPQNVPGKVWTRAEMQPIADLAKKHNLFVFSDEVYDRLTYDGCSHESIATLPDMWERTVIMASCGKTLSTTGWKVGWVVAPKELAAAVHNAQTLQTFSVSTPFQIAAARSLKAAAGNGYFEALPERYLARRAQLCDALKAAGLPPTIPQGSFFVLADISAVDESVYLGEQGADEPPLGRDWLFCRWMTKQIGVTAIPTTAFCRDSSRPIYERYARFAFCKTEEQIADAAKRLLAIKASLKKPQA